ncbi:hypothetical protein QQ73_00740 [Candidatus Endoriftia persephone str. Guaymas]|uniref:Uncharacterized protein n=1 Tax=Candidatus Endoriftia persephonae TaxID=393765 RepID=A0A9J6ZZE4_9GAMM|nr:hypothetical protein [Candidatus Endoriftia persephone]MBA1329783.1 hypothetical protein [Candidatus Endoriftia persephone str. Guaymas]USF88238.1 hypothetical protein L0Y14_03075 [Candidatus Endoriftia persephone]
MPTQTSSRGGLVKRFLRSLGLFFLLMVPVFGAVVGAEEDSYLSEISLEAEKLDRAKPDAVGESAASEVAIEGASQEEFEADLKSRYVGSYTFYMKLPPASQEEVFQDYRDGAAISDIRKKIMDRFLKR